MVPIEKRRNAAQENREKILESAITLFQQKGFENVTIDDIVKAAGFSRGTFYKLFVSKEDLVVSYMVRWNALYEEFYHKELEHSEMEAPEKIRLLVRHMLLASTRGGQELQRVAIASGMRDKLLAEKVSKVDAEITNILQCVLTDGQAQGTVTARYSVSELIRMIYIVMEGIALQWAGRYDGQPIEDTAGNAVEMLVDLLKQ